MNKKHITDNAILTKNICLVEINECDLIKEAYSLIMKASKVVADELGMTKENCPSFSGFMNWSSFQHVKGMNIQMLGYKIENQLVACGAIDFKKVDRPTLRYIAVDPKFQRWGVGTMLMKQLEKRLLHHGIKTSHLGAIAENKKLIKWYENMGYVTKRTMQLRKSNYHVCMMRKEL